MNTPSTLLLTLDIEYADVTDAILKTNITTLLSDPAIQPYFRSLSITDQPRYQPTALRVNKEKHLILSLSSPDPKALTGFVTGLFGFIDSLPKLVIRPDTKAKLKKARETVEKDLKEASERDAKELAEEEKADKRAAKKKAEEERISKLSASEQQKYLDKERKRSLRKSQGKVARK